MFVRFLIFMVIVIFFVEGVFVCEVVVSFSVWKFRVGILVFCIVGRGCVIFVLVFVYFVWFFCMKYIVKGNIVFISFFYSVYFFFWDFMNVFFIRKKM